VPVPAATETPASSRVAGTLDELRTAPSVYDDLHVEARRVLDRNPEPRNLRDVAVALEAMGYTESQAQALGFATVFDLAVAVFDLAYLYFVPRDVEVAPPRNTWRSYLTDYVTGSWYAVPWIMSLVVLFLGRVALWSSLAASPQVSAVVSLAFFLAAALAGATSQMLARKGSFYFLQGNFALVRWTIVRVMGYGAAGAALSIALVYAFYVVPAYGLRLGATFAEFAPAIFAFLVSAAPLYMLRRYGTLAVTTGVALLVTLIGSHVLVGASAGVRHAQLVGLAVGSGAMVVLAVSFLTVRARTVKSGEDPPSEVKPPALRVVLWHGAPYALYGLGYFVLILGPAMVAGLAYGRYLGVHRFVYPPTVEGSIDLALLELVVLVGLVHSSIERFGRRLRPLLSSQRLERWPEVRRALRREWWTSVAVVSASSAVVAWAAPTVLLTVLPSAVTASVRSPGGSQALHVAVVGFAIVPLGMLCSQYLFFLGRPAGPVAGVLTGAVVAVVTGAVLVAGGDLAQVAWGLVAGAVVYTAVAGLASFLALSKGEESFYASF
jgi:hypothetical protein